MKKVMGLFGLLGLVSTGAWADTASVDVGATVGTLGLGLQAGYIVIPETFALRANLGYLNYSTNKTSSGINYTGSLKLQNLGLLADWHPFGGVFRGTGGVYYNNNQFNINGQLTQGQTYTANNVAYTAGPNDSANATVKFRTFVPYLGIGLGDASLTPGFHFTSDIGIMFQGTPSATVAINNPAAANYSAQAQAKLQSDLNSFRYYPVAQVGMVYRF